jgi:hypothetical protein
MTAESPACKICGNVRENKVYTVKGMKYELPEKSIFDRKEMGIFKQRAAELNRDKRGDQACFYLVKN